MTTQTTRVRWNDWAGEVFDRAKDEGKLVLLDIGATWCHWCHVMDSVTYNDPEAAELINQRFIPVRIDRDRLNDVDAKYQREMPLISPQGYVGGWPLTVLITPEGYTLFKGTFLPPRAPNDFGSPIGLIDVLRHVDDYWRKNKEQVEEAGKQQHIRSADRMESLYLSPGSPDEQAIATVLQGMQDHFDSEYGGFGGAPKFYITPSLEMLTALAWQNRRPAAQMLATTLDNIARGGVHDRLVGGFHRYSVDQRWHVPHFEKMAYDNAPLLTVFADAYALTGKADYADVVGSTLSWIADTLTDPQGRGFYSSQDADTHQGDDGDHFTWTIDEIRQACGDLAETVIACYGVTENGHVHNRPGRNVLHLRRPLDQQARLLGMSEAELRRTLEQANKRLLEARQKRTAPAVDKTIFADINGMMIDAHLTAWQRLGNEEARARALTAADAMLQNLRHESGVFAHYAEDGQLHGVGRLGDQAWMARALVNCFCATGELRYLQAAKHTGDYIVANLLTGEGGLLSKPTPHELSPAAVEPGQSWEDSPARSPASVAVQALDDLSYYSGDQQYSQAADKAIRSFAGGVRRDWAPFISGFAIALEHHLHGPRGIVVLGPADSPQTLELEQVARRTYVPGGRTLALDPALAAHRELARTLGYEAQNRPVAYVCRGASCLAPAFSGDELRQRLSEMGGISRAAA